MKKLIYSEEDLDLILSLKIQEYEDKMYNIQKRIDKAIETNENIRKKLLSCSSYEKEEVEDLILLQEDILKGEIWIKIGQEIVELMQQH